MVRMDSYLLKSLTHGKIRGLAQLCMICIINLSRTAHVHDNLLEWLGTLIYSKLRNGDKSPFKNKHIHLPQFQCLKQNPPHLISCNFKII